MAMASARFARSAYNVANVNTPNFQARPVDAVQATRPETSDQAKSAGMASSYADPYHGEMGVSTTDLTSETIQQVSAVNAFKANLAMLRADDDRTRRLLDIKA